MKTLTTLIVTSALLLGTTAASAANLYQDPTSVKTEAFNSRDAAYQAGINKLSALENASPRQLSREVDLFVTDNMRANSVKLEDGAYVTIEERMSANGELEYVGVVNIDIDYEYSHDDD